MSSSITHRTFALFAMLLTLNQVSKAQNPIVLRRADVLRTETVADGSIRYLDGDVWITHDTLSVTCEHAKYEEHLGRLHAEENVHFIEPTRQMWADKAVYYERDGRAIAEGNARIEQDSLLIFCDRVIYNEAREEAFFFGDVEIYSLPDKVQLTGNHGAYSRPQDRGVMTQNPRMVRHLEADDSLVIVGDIIEYYFSDEYAIVTDNVQIERQLFDAWGKQLFYWDEQERAQLIGDPILKHKKDLLAADTVDAYFKDKHLDRVVLTGQAVATSPADTLAEEPVNRMTGKTMEITFKEDNVDSIYVRGNATSLYFIREDEGEKGANKVSGDLIDIWMNQGRISWIYVEGGTEGTYFPEHLEHRIETPEKQPVISGGGL